MKKFRFVFIAISVLILAVMALSLVSCSNKDDNLTGIKSVELNKKGEKVLLKVTLDENFAKTHAKEVLYLLGLPNADADGSLDGAVVIDQMKAKKNMNFKFDLYRGDTSLLSYGFVIATKNGNSYMAITEVAYIENPEVLASSSKGANSSAGIKGLATTDVFGSEIVGAEHIMLDARIDKLMLPEFERDAIAFNYNRITYYFDKECVEELDKLVKDADAAGMRVYFRTYLGMHDARENSNASDESTPVRNYNRIYCDGATAGANGYLPNLSDTQTAEWIKAFYAFMGDRYDVADYVIGDSVNNYKVNCNAGSLTAEEFEKTYYYWARIASLILSSQNSSAKVYVPIDNSWQMESTDGHIGSKLFLTRFAADAKKSGDYPYAVALDLGNGEDINSLLSGNTDDYTRMGITELSEFKNLLSKTEFQYNSEMRRMIIDDLDLSGVETEANRAAYYTYAYYSAAQNGFAAFITSTPIYGENGARSDFYYSVLMCGSDVNSQLSDYTDKLTNVSIPSFSDNKTLDLTYAQNPTFEISNAALKNKKSFPLSFEDFTLHGSAFNSQCKTVTDSKGNTTRLWQIDADCTEGTGAVLSKSIRAKEIIKSGYIGITMSSKTQAKIALVITSESSKTYSYVGEATVANASTTYYFDISDFAKDVKSSDMIEISICIIPDGEAVESLEISDVSLYGSSGKGVGTVIVIIVVIVVVLALVGLVVLLAIKRKKNGADGRG